MQYSALVWWRILRTKLPHVRDRQGCVEDMGLCTAGVAEIIRQLGHPSKGRVHVGWWPFRSLPKTVIPPTWLMACRNCVPQRKQILSNLKYLKPEGKVQISPTVGLPQRPAAKEFTDTAAVGVLEQSCKPNPQNPQ